jgi:hypothetical protein
MSCVLGGAFSYSRYQCVSSSETVDFLSRIFGLFQLRDLYRTFDRRIRKARSCIWLHSFPDYHPTKVLSGTAVATASFRICFSNNSPLHSCDYRGSQEMSDRGIRVGMERKSVDNYISTPLPELFVPVLHIPTELVRSPFSVT